jgi:hypothetical protein
MTGDPPDRAGNVRRVTVLSRTDIRYQAHETVRT